jgi:hypothetical protein
MLLPCACRVFATCKEQHFERMEKIAPFAAAVSYKQYRQAIWGYYANTKLGWLATLLAIAKAEPAPSTFVVGHTPPQSKYVENPNYKPQVVSGEEHWEQDTRLVPGHTTRVSKEERSEVRNHIYIRMARKPAHARCVYPVFCIAGVSVQHLREKSNCRGPETLESSLFRVCVGLHPPATGTGRLHFYYRAWDHPAGMLQHQEQAFSGAPGALRLLRSFARLRVR